VNIFILSEDPAECARFHNDRHVSKMILECAQILSTAHIMLDGRETAKARVPLVERPTHIHHPSAVWARKCDANYRWVAALMHHLLQQFALRNGRTHEYARFSYEYGNHAPLNIPVAMERTHFVYVGPAMYQRSSVVESYRLVYVNQHADKAVWSRVGAPQWWRDMTKHQGVRHAS
jgi:hypothetical protein